VTLFFFFVLCSAGGDLYAEEQHEATLAKLEKTRRYQSDLDGQLATQESKRHEAYEQFLKDKAMIDEIVLRIQEEDDDESRRAQDHKAHTRAEEEAFEEEREAYKRGMLEQMKREVSPIRFRSTHDASRIIHPHASLLFALLDDSRHAFMLFRRMRSLRGRPPRQTPAKHRSRQPRPVSV
jgi:hypothetical protein